MKWPHLLFMAALAVAPSSAAVLRNHVVSAAKAEIASSASLMELQRVEAEDMRFWTSEWGAMEKELQKLAEIAAAPDTPAADSAGDLLKKLNLNPKSVADLAPALAMLKGLYEDGKERIAKLNEREKESKEKAAAKEAEHKERLAKIEARFANHSLSAEFRTNETNDENRLYKYWERVRQRQHHQYHTGLKIQHATLEKVKKMIDMYEKTMSGTANAAEVKKMLKKVAPPEIVLLQDLRTSVGHFCTEALADVKSAKAAVRSVDHEDQIGVDA